MDNRQSNAQPEDFSSPQQSASSSAATGGVPGNYNSNTGNNNNFGSNNTTTINYHGTDSPTDYEILQSLYKAPYEEQRSRIQKPVKGTCTWITEHEKYKDWLQKRTSSVLWLSADPGCGKSVAASFLVDYLGIHTKATICYFFFKDDSDQQMSGAFALCAILHQIFKKKRDLIKFAKEERMDRGSGFTQEVGTLWAILVKAVGEEGCGEVICVVDALDECEQETATRLIPLVAQLPESQSSAVPLKLIVTSRPYQYIERGLCSRTPTIRLKGEEAVSAVTADVARVIDDGINELEAYWKRTGELGYLRDILRTSAGGTFLWVSLVLAKLKSSDDSSRSELTRIATSAPRNLDEFYSKILKKIESHEKAEKILSIVVAAARPLTLQEMNAAFRMNRDLKSIDGLEPFSPDFERTVKSVCGHFVRIKDSRIYLVHKTARDFLLRASSGGQIGWKYTLCHEDSHFMLADICISYLSLEDFEKGPVWGDAAGDLTRLNFEDYVRKYAFLDYASRHWAEHFRDSGKRQMELFESTRVICEAGTKRLLTWFQVYWYQSTESRPGSQPTDWTHLMIASMLGQGAVVERILEQGGDNNARSEAYGTALNIAALWKDKDMTERLLKGNVIAIINGNEYNISQSKWSELSWLDFPWRENLWREEFDLWREEDDDKRDYFVTKFLKPYFIHDTPAPPTSTS